MNNHGLRDQSGAPSGVLRVRRCLLPIGRAIRLPRFHCRCSPRSARSGVPKFLVGCRRCVVGCKLLCHASDADDPSPPVRENAPAHAQTGAGARGLKRQPGKTMARRMLVILLLVILLGISIVTGIIAADWPSWRRALVAPADPGESPDRSCQATAAAGNGGRRTLRSQWSAGRIFERPGRASPDRNAPAPL